MPLIGLLTDWGIQDAYVASVKAILYSKIPRLDIVDVSHSVAPQNVEMGSRILESCLNYFPAKSIFICVVDPGVGSNRNIIAVKSKKRIYLAPDNGLLSGVFDQDPNAIARVVDWKKWINSKSISKTFQGRDVFTPLAIKLFKQPSFFDQAGPILPLPEKVSRKLVRSKKSIVGEIVYFDHFGNALTSIKYNDLPESDWKRTQVTVKRLKLGVPIQYYSQNASFSALFSSCGYLELAVRNGSFKQQTGFAEKEPIHISWL